MPSLEDAIELAVQAHRGMTDKARQPYVLHALRVMFRLSTEDERITAVLHDVLEDTRVTLADLKKRGYSPAVLAALDRLTRRKGDETYGEFIERVSLDPLATRVKLADLEDNMDLRRLPRLGPEDLERLARYRKAWGWLCDAAARQRPARPERPAGREKAKHGRRWRG
jgi:(p)ppGpp synthase/HD superfamily hydrolase